MRRVVIPAALVILISAGLSSCSDESPSKASQTAGNDTRRIVVERLADVAAPAGGSAAADVVPLNDSTLSAELAAKVIAIRADVGSSVARGERLLELDPTDYRLALAQADAQVAAAAAATAQADARLKRARDLHARQYVSDDELSTAVTQAESASAEWRIRKAARSVAARQLEKATIFAPFDGVIVARMAQVGNTVSAGSPLLRLIDLATPHVEARLQPEQASQLASALDVSLELGGERLPLRVSQIAEAADPGSRTRVVRLTFAERPAQPGLSGTLRWTQAGFEVPSSLLVQREGGLGLFTERDGRAHWIALAGATGGRGVMAELSADLPVVTHGQHSLAEGDPIASGVPATADSPADGSGTNDPAAPVGAR